MATLFLPFFTAVDGNGVPRAGALLYFYQTGTTTPQNTYTDSTLASANANPVVADSNGLFPPIYLSATSDYKVILQTSAGTVIATRDPLGYTSVSPIIIRSFLAGLTLSTAGGSSTFGVSAGVCSDSINSVMMSLSVFTKTTATWGLGSGLGALDTGAIANSTWYHVFLIQRPDALAVGDVLISLSPTTPTMPSGYSSFRRIGSMKTDGSAHWIAFIQDGDLFQWVAPVANDIAGNTPTTAAVSRTLTVPTGINVIANFQLVVVSLDTTTATSAYCSDLATNDVAAVNNSFQDNADTGSVAAAFLVAGGGTRLSVRTNTAAQIRSRFSFSSALVNFAFNTLGWVDSRGRTA